MEQALIEEHHALQQQLAEDPAGVDLARVLGLIERTRQAGRYVESPPRRDQLRAILRHWGAFVHERSGEFPPAQLAPFEGGPRRAGLWRALRRFWPALLLIVFAVVALVTWIRFPPSATLIETPTPTPTDTPTSTPTPALASLTLVNDSGQTICYVEAAPGGNLLGETEVVPSGAGYTFFVPAGRYDLTARDCERNPIDERQDVDVTGETRWLVGGLYEEEEALLTVHNNSGRAICFLAISTGPGWGENRLAPGEEIASGASRLFVLPLGTYNLRAEDCSRRLIGAQEGVVVTDAFKWTLEWPTPTPTLTPTITPSPSPTPTPGVEVTPSPARPAAIAPDNAGQVIPLRSLVGHEGPVLSLAFSPDGRYLASGGADGTVRLWEVEGRLVPVVFEAHAGWVRAVAFDPDGRHLASGGNDGVVRLWDIDTARVFAVLDTREGFVFDLVFPPGGLQLATSSGDGALGFWDVGSGSQLATIRRGDGAVHAIGFTPDGSLFAATGGDGVVYVLADPPGGPERCRWTGAPAQALAFHPDGRQLAVGDERGEVVVLDVTGVADFTACPRVSVWRAHPDGVNDVAYSPSGLLLATAGEDTAVRLWTPVATRAAAAALDGHRAAVRAVAFGPDGRYLASGSADGTIILWGLSE